MFHYSASLHALAIADGAHRPFVNYANCAGRLSSIFGNLRLIRSCAIAKAAPLLEENELSQSAAMGGALTSREMSRSCPCPVSLRHISVLGPAPREESRDAATAGISGGDPPSALQYAMRDRLIALGWSHIETVDDDLGRSAAGAVTRAGFDRTVAEACLGQDGAMAARETWRFAGNSRNWQQVVVMCRVVDTVLVDQQVVYALRQGNDRLLLGLKGSLNEHELDPLRQRSPFRPLLRRLAVASPSSLFR